MPYMYIYMIYENQLIIFLVFFNYFQENISPSPPLAPTCDSSRRSGFGTLARCKTSAARTASLHIGVTPPPPSIKATMKG